MRLGRSASSAPRAPFGTSPTRLMCAITAAAVLVLGWTGSVHAFGPVGVTFPANENTLGVVPPDPDCAAGPQSVISTVNVNMAIWDKSGTRLFEAELDDFFDELRARDSIQFNFVFDPRIVYDQYLDKFILIVLANQTGNNGAFTDSFLLMAVSRSPNPTGDNQQAGQRDWLKFSFKIDTTSNWADYPAIGMDEDRIYVNYNMFPKQAGGVFARMHQIDKTALQDPINPPPNLPARFFDNIATANGGGAFTIQPAHSFGPTQTEWFVSINGSFVEDDQVFLYARDGGASPNNFQQFAVTVPPFRAPAGSGRQLGGSDLQTVSGRFNNNAVWRDNSLWCTHTIKGQSGTVVRWYEFDTSPFPNDPVLVQSGDVTDGPEGIGGIVDNFMPGIMVNPTGDMLVSYTCAGPNLFPSICYAHRFKGDSLGTTRAPTLVVPGQFTYVGFGGGLERWGDYSGIALDPADESTFWIFHEVANAAGNWRTWFGSATLTVAGGGGGPPGPPVPSAIVVERPSQFENFVTGTTERITWSAFGTPEAPVRLLLFRGDQLVGEIQTDLPASQQAFDWTVGDPANSGVPLVEGETYRIRIAAVNDPSVFDDSNAFFRITHKVLIDAGVFDSTGALQTETEFVPGESVQLNAMATEGLAPYFFKWTPQNFLDNPNSANPIARPLRTVTYAVTVRDSTGNESDPANVTLTAGNPLRVDAGASQLFPAGGNVIIEGSVSGGAPPYTIEWFDCDPSACANPAVADTIQPIVSPAAETIFFLRVTDAAGDVLMDNVLVEPGFNVGLENDPGNGGAIVRSPIQSLYRFTDEVTYTASPSPGFVFDHWDGDASGTANPFTIPFPNDNLTVQAVYRVDTSAATPDSTGSLPVPTGNCGPGMAGGFMMAGLCLLFIRQRRRLRR